MSDKYYTLQEAAERLGEPSETVKSWIDQGQLLALKDRSSGRILIPDEAVQSFALVTESVRQLPSQGTATMTRIAVPVPDVTDLIPIDSEHVGEIAAGGITVQFLILVAKQAYKRYERRHKQRKAAMEARDLFEALFGVPDMIRTYDEGTHPDNLAAGDVLSPIFGMHDQKGKQSPESRQPVESPEGDFVLIGGPTSTHLTRVAWEFEGTNLRQLDRPLEPIIPFRFYGISNEQDSRIPRERVGWHLEGVGPVSTVPWPYIDTTGGIDSLIPKLDKKFKVNGGDAYLPRNNYLLVTKLPNFLSARRQGDPITWPKMVVFEGNNGLGTRGAELLLQHEGLRALEHLDTTLKKKGATGASAFQAIFEVSDIEETHDKFHRFRNIELLEESIHRLDISKQTYERAYMKLKDRI
jgi:excisionase family DNA binding protein